MSESLEQERLDFNEKIRVKMKNGFVPDILRMERNTYFVKQFWREPYFVKLYLGYILQREREYLLQFVGPGARLLDVGCGAGYLSLELARMGFHVTAIDIADAAIEAARDTLKSAVRGDSFGSLRYEPVAFPPATFADEPAFDAVVFSASLHHFPDIDATVQAALSLCRPGGLILAYEPARRPWTQGDAAVLTLLRCALAITGNWYDTALCSAATSDAAFDEAVLAVLAEYTENKDEFTPNGQSENDDALAGPKVERALRDHAELIAVAPATAFLHSGLGGLRANDDETLHRLGDLLAVFERYALERDIINPSVEFFVARRRTAPH